VYIEVKVDAVEQIGQCIKYRDYFVGQGYTAHAAGLITRMKTPGCRNDNEPFFEFLGIPRILWSELLLTFEAKSVPHLSSRLFARLVASYTLTLALTPVSHLDRNLLTAIAPRSPAIPES
jgi:hypothetical protein